MPIHTIFVHVCAEIASVSVQEVLLYLPFKENTKALMERTEHNSVYLRHLKKMWSCTRS